MKKEEEEEGVKSGVSKNKNENRKQQVETNSKGPDSRAKKFMFHRSFHGSKIQGILAGSPNL